jgi:2Fe-2S ferredoxin
MPKLIIKDRSGKKSEIEYDSNFTLMETLRDYGYDIEASCGGCCACATCHVYINEKWINKLKNMDDEEESMLDQAFDVKNNSRLSCQIDLSGELDGLEIEIAPD